MYYAHFGLHSPPFKITPNTELFYTGAQRGLILDALVYVIVQGEGIVKVVGEVGSGKTMLCRMLETRLPPHINVIYLAQPNLPADMILHAIALEMGLNIDTHTHRLQVMQMLNHALLEHHHDNKQVVVFIEEAQAMPCETLEEIRLLSNLETSHHKLLQIVLFGQPELDETLKDNSIRQVTERITHHFYLPRFSRADIADYIQFRLHAVGYRGTTLFSPMAIWQLSHYSNGLTRRIHILADKALLTAFSENAAKVKRKHIQRAAKDSVFIPNSLSFIHRTLLFVMIGLAIIGGTAYFLFPPSTITLFSPFIKKIIQQRPIATQQQHDKYILSIPDFPALQARLQATQQWLSHTPHSHFTLQVLAAPLDKQADIEKLLSHLAVQKFINELYLFKQTKEWILIYGNFSKREQAQQAMTTLPHLLKKNKPFLQTIANLYTP